MTEEDSVLGLLFKQAEDLKSSLIEALISGSARDHAAYTGLCGRIHGISEVQGLINAMADRLRRQSE